MFIARGPIGKKKVEITLGLKHVKRLPKTVESSKTSSGMDTCKRNEKDERSTKATLIVWLPDNPNLAPTGRTDYHGPDPSLPTSLEEGVFRPFSGNSLIVDGPGIEVVGEAGVCPACPEYPL